MSSRASRRAALVVFLFVWTLTTHGKYSASGDEPHYLMIAHSLVTDGDLDVANNYAANDGRFFGHENLEMGLHAVPARSGRIRPIHHVGLAVAIAPVYVVAQRLATLPSESLLARARMTRGLFAYSIIGIVLIALTSVGIMMLAEGLRSLTSPASAALLAAAAGISPPIASHAFLVFPEVLALFTTCLVVWLALDPDDSRDTPKLMGTLLAIGLLPWTHQKYLLYTPGLLFVLLWMRRPLIARLQPRARIVAGLLFVLPQAGMLLWILNEWGTLGGALTTGGLPFSWEMFRTGVHGLLLDRQSGLLAYAPFYWMAPAAFVLARRRVWPFLVPALLLYLPAAAFTIGWWAGFSPAARYIAPLVPFAVAAIAAAWQHRPVRIGTAVLLAAQLAIDLTVWQRPRGLWPPPDGSSDNAALDALGIVGRAYEALLPAAHAAGDYGRAAIILVVAAIATTVLVRISTADAPEPRERVSRVS